MGAGFVSHCEQNAGLSGARNEVKAGRFSWRPHRCFYLPFLRVTQYLSMEWNHVKVPEGKERAPGPLALRTTPLPGVDRAGSLCGLHAVWVSEF